MTHLDVLTTSENKVIGRKEVSLRLSYDASTPKTDDVRNLVAVHLKTKPELVKVIDIMPAYGDRYAKVRVNIYHDEPTFKKFEVVNKKAKKEKKEAAPQQEQKK